MEEIGGDKEDLVEVEDMIEEIEEAEEDLVIEVEEEVEEVEEELHLTQTKEQLFLMQERGVNYCDEIILKIFDFKIDGKLFI